MLLLVRGEFEKYWPQKQQMDERYSCLKLGSQRETVACMEEETANPNEATAAEQQSLVCL